MNPLDSSAFIQAFRQSSPYINAHRKKTAVIFLSDQALASEYLTRVVYDIALLNSLGMRTVVVLGTRQILGQMLEANGIDNSMHKGRRITSAKALQLAKQITGQYRFDLEAKFSNALPNTPMHGANMQVLSGNFIMAKPLGIIDGVDYQFSASVRKVNQQALQNLLNNDAIILLSNIAYSATGECFNVRAEEVAIATAKALRADKFIVYGSDQELQDLPRELQLSQAQNMAKNTQSANFACLVEACEAGIDRNHFISFEQDGALLAELFTTNGSGTLLSQGVFESIRKASLQDIGAITHLLAPMAASGQLINRDKEQLEQFIDYFYVTERDQNIIACAALVPFDTMAEIASVATDPAFQGDNKASELLAFLQKKAKQQGFNEVFVLTTQSAHFFLQQGFSPIAIEQLPQHKQQMLDKNRGSKAYSKALL